MSVLRDEDEAAFAALALLTAALNDLVSARFAIFLTCLTIDAFTVDTGSSNDREGTTPLRARMNDGMRIHGMRDKARNAHIRAVKDFAGFRRRSPDTATPDDLRAYQLRMMDTGVTPTTYNAEIMALRFLLLRPAKV